VNDIVIAKFSELDQAVVVLAGEDYVALQVDFQDSDLPEEPREFDQTVLLSAAAAERLGCALVQAAQHVADVEEHRLEVVETEKS
jgi:hypothetical protein